MTASQVSSRIERVKVAELNEIAEGRSKIVNLDGRNVAVFKVKNEYLAVSNNCLHRGGPLAEGDVRNYEVTCPWHGWKYSLLDGSLSLIPTLKVKTYKVTQDPDGIFVEIKAN